MGRSDLSQVTVSLTVFLIMLCAPLITRAPQQMFIMFIKKAFKKQFYSYGCILLPCNSLLISKDVSVHQILSELREVSLLDYLPVQGFVCSLPLDSYLQIMTSLAKKTIL